MIPLRYCANSTTCVCSAVCSGPCSFCWSCCVSICMCVCAFVCVCAYVHLCVSVCGVQKIAYAFIQALLLSHAPLWKMVCEGSWWCVYCTAKQAVLTQTLQLVSNSTFCHESNLAVFFFVLSVCLWGNYHHFKTIILLSRIPLGQWNCLQGHTSWNTPYIVIFFHYSFFNAFQFPLTKPNDELPHCGGPTNQFISNRVSRFSQAALRRAPFHARKQLMSNCVPQLNGDGWLRQLWIIGLASFE